MKDKLRYTHDDLFRATWSDKENAGSFLENNLPAPVRELVDLETLEICKNSFIDNDLKDYYSDMLYKARIGNSQGFVYFLFEHKSYQDRNIYLQLLGYMIKIWQLGLKQSTAGKLSIIIPMVVYHGKGEWRLDNRFASMFDGPVDELARFIPNFEILLYDLSQYMDHQIMGTEVVRVTLLLFKHIFDPDIADKLYNILMQLKSLVEKEPGLQYFDSLLKYLLSNVDNMTTEKMHAIVSDSLSEEKGGLIMTLAEQLEKNGIQKGLEQGLAQGLAKGRKEGRKEGREEGLLEGIEVAVTVKFGDSNEFNTIIAKIKNIQDVNLLRALKDKIISAGTVSELMQFIDN